MISIHSLLIFNTFLVFKITNTNDSDIIKIIISLFGLLVYLFITIINVAMLLIFVKDISSYGGTLLNSAINIAKAKSGELLKVDSGINMNIINADLKLVRRDTIRENNIAKLENKRLKNINILNNNCTEEDLDNKN